MHACLFSKFTHGRLSRNLPGFDLAPLASLPQLRLLNIVDARPGLDLAPLAESKNLTIQIREGQDVRNKEAFRGRVIECPS